LVFAIILAAKFLKEKITWQVVAGGVLMVTGALIIAFSKRYPDSRTSFPRNSRLFSFNFKSAMVVLLILAAQVHQFVPEALEMNFN
jgi:drug/metabolite transporter (DMT)-like permease